MCAFTVSEHPWLAGSALFLAFAATTAIVGCRGRGVEMVTAETPGAVVHDVDAAGEDGAWQVLRVGGDVAAAVVQRGENFYFGQSAITTPLPAGYPPPTPPGAIDLKRYPSIRRAEVDGGSNPDLGMNFAFWPLFRHIKDRGIAMTSPVEMDYRGGGESRAGSEWTMSFVYRTADLGPTGDAGRVRVVDTEPMTVLALGGQGSYARRRVQDGIETLRRWLDEHPEWRAAGEPRALYYNGPEMPGSRKWYEVQIPVREVSAGSR
ncbi:MAG: heme-binding protein [Phycisphaeraceae bacterium]|nr:heme-binding protein [Phycisphaeraceae bacterium]